MPILRTISVPWRGNQWLVMMQPHRGCTLDSPGLPTIGGYPGEQGVRDATPLGVVLLFNPFPNIILRHNFSLAQIAIEQ